jgi:hypothetical protein
LDITVISDREALPSLQFHCARLDGTHEIIA